MDQYCLLALHRDGFRGTKSGLGPSNYKKKKVKKKKKVVFAN
jgi:hypothetical protein